MQTFTRVANLILIMMLLGMILATTGCGKTDENGQTVGQKVDQTIDKTNQQAARARTELEQAANKAGEKIEQGAEKAQTKAQSAMQDAAASAREKAGEVTSVVDDSAITASVKADILKDPKLSALKVEVSTEKGEVTLTGKVDNEAARQRAGQVAAAVSGVHKVNNQLQVAAGKAKGDSASA